MGRLLLTWDFFSLFCLSLQSQFAAKQSSVHYRGTTLLMSTGVDARRRPSLWSYISFSSSPRRRSISLPKHSNQNDPFEKADRHTLNGSANGSASTLENIKDAWMTQSQRSRYLKTGGLIAFVLVVLFLLSPGERQNVKDLVGSMLDIDLLPRFENAYTNLLLN